MEPSPLNHAQLRKRLTQHVHVLAEEIGERNVFNPRALRRAEEFIASAWRAQGYEVTRHEYELHRERWANVEVTRRGARRPEQMVLVGAHYDSVIGSPGANDNATGVAAMLEISRRMASAHPERTVRFVAFVNEEPPFFKTPQMGSRVYARQARERGDDFRAMLSLETIGYYSEAKGSQQYPPLFGFFYPDRGNFIAFVGNFSSRALVHRAERAFRSHSDFPIESVTTFGAVPGVDWSDHGSFWKHDYQALMVTDTALYRYPYYHTAADTPDKVNYDALARVTDGLGAVIMDLARSD
jgi:Zn-dependent M28 family amino/carboxypeptidase